MITHDMCKNELESDKTNNCKPLPMSNSTISTSHHTFPPSPTPSPCPKSGDRKNFISLLQNCTHISQVFPIHSKIIRTKHDQDPFVVFQLLRVSSNLNSIDYACKIFANTRNRNVFLYTALIDGLVQSERFNDGICLYREMIGLWNLPDKYVSVSVLKACVCLLALEEGRQVHCQVLKLGFGSNRSIRMKLVELYGKCGKFSDAKNVFDEMPERDVVALTVLIDCYFDRGMVDEAVGVFSTIERKDVVSWTAMIDGFERNGEMNRALEMFREMLREGVRANEVTLVCVLSACSQLGAVELGRWVHSYLGKEGIGVNHFVGGALINMYLRCGDVDEALWVFEGMKERNVITYNSMITGLALNGKSIEAIELFWEMLNRGFRPTNVTFVGVLNACSHGGFVDLGFEIFDLMSRVYGIEPQVEHYGCMVDLLGRMGRLEEAYDLIKTMKVAPDHVILGALLSACKIHGNIKLGERVVEMLVACGGADSGTYVLLSNVYSSSGRWKEAARVRAKMKERGFEKEPGCSSIEVNNEIHEFLLGDLRHPIREEIYKLLEDLNKVVILEGYNPATEVMLHHI